MDDGRSSPASRVCYMEEEHIYGYVSNSGAAEVERGVEGLRIDQDPCGEVLLGLTL